MDDEAARIVADLGLEPHPEGGWFKRVWTAAQQDANGRPAGSAIQYLIEGGAESSWHRIDASEMWVHSRGAPLQLRVSDGSAIDDAITLGPDDSQEPQHVVEPGRWQSARSLGDWSLVVCVVVPGFVWEGFEVLGSGAHPG